MAEPVAGRAPARLWLVVLLAAGLLLRLWLWHGRWINPDEGAHLMDGRLTLQGLVPLLDFDSRQVGYTYLLAGLVGLFGSDYALIRLCVILATLLNALLIYAIARRLLGERVGLLAAAIYLFLPLAAIFAPIVHMEPFASLAACLAFYLLLRHLEPGGGWGALAGAGAMLGLGYYVRESNLAAAVAAAGFLAVCTPGEPRLLLRRCAVLAGGFLVPCAAIGLAYSPRLTLGEWWWGSLNPLSIVLRSSAQLVAGVAAGGLHELRVEQQPWATTLRYLREVWRLDFVLVTGAALSLAVLVLAPRRDGRARLRRPYALLYAWTGALALVYGYWSLHRGFFPQYAEEFIPPLAILLASVTVELLARWGFDRAFGPAAAGLGAYALGAFLLFHFAPRLDLPSYLYFVAPALALAWLQLAGAGRTARWLALAGGVAAWLGLVEVVPGLPVALLKLLKLATVPGLLAAAWLVSRRQPPPGRDAAAFAGVALMVAALGWSYAGAGRRLHRDYETVWSPAAVREIAGSLRSRGRPGDEVVSGAVIWEFNAGLLPFERISHPLQFLFGLTPPESAGLGRQLAASPPAFIVLDGYTEQTYGAVVPGFDRFLRERYALVDSAGPADYPVRLFERRAAAQAASGRAGGTLRRSR